jgi:hypothetical protein
MRSREYAESNKSDGRTDCHPEGFVFDGVFTSSDPV